MRRGDWAIGAIIGLVVVGAAGIFFFRSGAAKSDLVALEKFDDTRKPSSDPGTPRAPAIPESKPLASAVRPRTVTIPPAAPDHPVIPHTTTPSEPPRHDADSQTGPRGAESPSVRAESTPASPSDASESATRPPAEQRPVPPAAAEERASSAPPANSRMSDARPAAPGSISADTAGRISAPLGPPKLPVTHTVESGETLSEIAQRYYNNPSLVSLIKKANPELKDENRIVPGMKLLIPDRAAPTLRDAHAAGPADPHAVRPADAHTARPKTNESGAAAAIPATYRVQPKDTLINIAKRLYGDGRRWREIYDLNHAAIGPDPEKLNVDTVLKLPRPRAASTQPKR